MNRRTIIGGLILLLASAATAHADEWTWPDGKLAIQRPPAGQFTQDPAAPAPALVRWVASDGTAGVAALSVPNPTNEPMELSGLVEGTLKQLPQGTLVSSAQTTISGVPAFTIVVKGNSAVGVQYIGQVVIAFDGMVYKVMVASTSDPLQDKTLGPLLRSVRVVATAPKPPGASSSAGGVDNHQWSVKVAQWGIGILLIALLVKYIRRGSTPKPPAAPPPLPKV